MNIIFNTMKTLNTGYIASKKADNKSNLTMTSPLQTDTFVRSNVSFSGHDNISELQQARVHYEPKLPKVFRGDGINNFEIKEGKKTESVSDQKEIKKLFPATYGQPIIEFEEMSSKQTAKIGKSKHQNNKPLKVGIILSGGQAPGGHNVITGLYDALKKINPKSELYGFLGGPSGLVDDEYIKFDDKKIDSIRNTGGFDVIGSGRTKLETEEQFEKVLANCKKHDIGAITIVGGDDSNTNAAVLAEWLKAKGEKINVIGCPKTIDGDLKNEQIETSFGFDTATKTYAEIVGNIEKDSASAKKYWHFVKVMGRSASHVALEVALQTHPNVTLLSEEVEQKKLSLNDVVDYTAGVVAKRAKEGKNYGVAVIPEGLIEFFPEMKTLIGNLNDLAADESLQDVMQNGSVKDKIAATRENLGKDDLKVFNSLPESIQGQLLMDRDSHGNVQVSKIDTEKLIIQMVDKKLKDMKSEGKYNGKFSSQAHFVGYEGRCAFPSNFDADYCYSLGTTAAALINSGKTGYLASVKHLDKKADKWEAGGTPITMLFNMEKRSGKNKPVIRKALVEMDSPAFKELQKNRKEWATEDKYLIPGAIQYFGPSEVCDKTTKTLQLEHN